MVRFIVHKEMMLCVIGITMEDLIWRMLLVLGILILFV